MENETLFFPELCTRDIQALQGKPFHVQQSWNLPWRRVPGRRAILSVRRTPVLADGVKGQDWDESWEMGTGRCMDSIMSQSNRDFYGVCACVREQHHVSV